MVGEHADREVCKLVTGGPVDIPSWELFATRQDLLHEDHRTMSTVSIGSEPPSTSKVTFQSFEILGGFGKPVDMVYPDPCDSAISSKLEHEFVRF